MSHSMYRTSIPVLIHMLKNLGGLVKKAAAHAEIKNIEPSVLMNGRLFPDMWSFSKQVQVATDMAKGCAARLSGTEPPKYEDNEITFPELMLRVNKTIDFLNTFKPEQIDHSEDKSIQLKMKHIELNFTGIDYLNHFVLPNFYFHFTTAYNILRHAGVELGKQDFLGKREG